MTMTETVEVCWECGATADITRCEDCGHFICLLHDYQPSWAEAAADPDGGDDFYLCGPCYDADTRTGDRRT